MARKHRVDRILFRAVGAAWSQLLGLAATVYRLLVGGVGRLVRKLPVKHLTSVDGTPTGSFNKFWNKPWQETRISLLYVRILVINLVVLAIPVLGFLWADQYRSGLIEAEIESLHREAVLIANSLGEGAVQVQDDGRQELVSARVIYLARILARDTDARMRVFRPDGELLMDSSFGIAGFSSIEVKPIRDNQGIPFLSWLFDLGSQRSNTPPYIEPVIQRASDYQEALSSLMGRGESMVRVDDGGNLVVSVAEPVRRYRRVLGSLMLSRDKTTIEAEVNALRLLILQVSVVALIATVILSVYLAWTIARPVRRLAIATDKLRTGKAGDVEIPDLSHRHDEIGDLSLALRETTRALQDRMGAIESFAADVSHELKNPLTSLKSAVETAAMLKDPSKFSRLVDIIVQDVNRLDRLITDISNASRIDAELARTQGSRVSIVQMLETYKSSYDLTRDPDAPQLELDVPDDDALFVMGLEGRLGQVLRNLVGNALSFSQPHATVRLVADRIDQRKVVLMVEDEGPGLPEGKEEQVFSRFFTDRPETQGFGNHSGLGLAICRQIIEAHKGTIRGETIVDAMGNRLGARFVIVLPPYRDWQRTQSANDL